MDEKPWTKWNFLKENAKGPFELSIKENGCILFVSAVNGDLFVTSKHAHGNPHSLKGQEWLDKHLTNVNKTRGELIQFLEKHDITAVYEVRLGIDWNSWQMTILKNMARDRIDLFYTSNFIINDTILCFNCPLLCSNFIIK